MTLPGRLRYGINRGRPESPARSVISLIQLYNFLLQNEVDEHGAARP